MSAGSPRPDFKLLGIAALAIVVGLATAALFLGPLTPTGNDDAEDARVAALLDDEDFEDPAPAAPTREAAAGSTAATRPQEAPPTEEADDEEALEPCPDAWRDPIRLFGDAQVRPVYEHRTMLGVSIRGVKPGSFWEELGIESEDRIVEIDGAPIDTPQASVDMMNVLERDPRIRLRILTKEGRDRWISWDAPEPPDPETLPPHCR